MEALTGAIARRAWEHIQEVESLGGMAKAIETGLPTLEVDNTAVRQAQLRRLEQLRAERDEARVQAALNGITRAAETGEGNPSWSRS